MSNLSPRFEKQEAALLRAHIVSFVAGAVTYFVWYQLSTFGETWSIPFALMIFVLGYFAAVGSGFAVFYIHFDLSLADFYDDGHVVVTLCLYAVSYILGVVIIREAASNADLVAFGIFFFGFALAFQGLRVSGIGLLKVWHSIIHSNSNDSEGH